MAQDRGVGNWQRTIEQLLRGSDFLPREDHHLCVGKVEWGREINREIVAQLVLGERYAIAVGDLPPRRRDVEDVGARLFLRLEGRFDRLLEWRWRDFQRRFRFLA